MANVTGLLFNVTALTEKMENKKVEKTSCNIVEKNISRSVLLFSLCK